MGRSIRRSPSLKMNSKICLILFGLLVALAVLSAAENSEENSLSALSEEVASARLTREAEAGKRKRNNKAKRSKKNKKNKKACTCWTAPEFTISSEKVKSCKISSTASIAAGLKSCKEAFSKCRKYEDDAVASMAACSVTSAALKAKAAALSANSKTV